MWISVLRKGVWLTQLETEGFYLPLRTDATWAATAQASPYCPTNMFHSWCRGTTKRSYGSMAAHPAFVLSIKDYTAMPTLVTLVKWTSGEVNWWLEHLFSHRTTKKPSYGRFHWLLTWAIFFVTTINLEVKSFICLSSSNGIPRILWRCKGEQLTEVSGIFYIAMNLQGWICCQIRTLCCLWNARHRFFWKSVAREIFT